MPLGRRRLLRLRRPAVRRRSASSSATSPGKGSPAALLAAAVLGMFSAEATYQAGAASPITRVNAGLFRRAIEARFLTAFYGILRAGRLADLHQRRPQSADRSSRRPACAGSRPAASCSGCSRARRSTRRRVAARSRATCSCFQRRRHRGDERGGRGVRRRSPDRHAFEQPPRPGPAGDARGADRRTSRTFCGDAPQNDDITMLLCATTARRRPESSGSRSARPASVSVTVVPTPALAARPQSFRRSVRRCASRSSARVRCRSPWSRNTARRSCASASGSMPTPCRVTSTTTRRPSVGRRRARRSMRQRAAARHRVQRVLDHVGQRAREQRPVDEHRRQIRRRLRRRSRRGRPGRPDTARRPPRRAPARSVGSGRGVGDEAKLENSAEICRSSRTCDRIDVDALVEHRRQRAAAIEVDAPRVLGRQLNRRQRILDVVRDLPRHVGPGLEPLRALELGALPLQVVGHAVEVLDQPPQLVRRRGGDARVEIAARDAPRRARQPVHRVGDALGHPVAERRRRAARTAPTPTAPAGRARRSAARSPGCRSGCGTVTMPSRPPVRTGAAASR